MLTGNKDIDQIILNKLEDVDLVKMCQVNKQANDLCNDQTFWRNRIMTKFPEIPLDVLNKYRGNRTWSGYYIDDLLKANNHVSPNRVLYNSSDRLDHAIIALQNGANINLYNGQPLVQAIMKGNIDIVKYLVEHGADVNIRDAFGGLLVMASNKDIIEYLKSKGAMTKEF